MQLNNIIANIHWLPVIVLTIFSFAIGFVWHQSLLFGKAWKSENFPNGLPKFNAPLIFGGTAIVHLLAIAGLSGVASDKGALEGLLTGLFISLVWVLPSLAGTYLFANRSLKLLAIDAGMYIVLFTISGLVLGVW